MKKMKIAMTAGAIILALSACGQIVDTKEARTESEKLMIEPIDDADEVQKTQGVDLADTDSAENIGEERPTVDGADEIDAAEKKDDTNLPELYEAFLKNEIGVPNPYVEGMDLTVMDDKNYESEFEDVWKKYAYVDVNDDGNPELILKIGSNPSELMYILGIYDDELVCFDVFETHTKNIAFGVYDYGFVWEMQDYDGFGMTFYTYTAEGKPVEARHFTEENEADIAAYEGEEPQWIDWQ